MSDPKKIGRRDAARRALVVLGAAAIAPSALAGCGDDESDSGGLSCTQTTGLSPAEIQTRQSQNYVDHSPNADQKCENCRFYTAPAQQGACGGCQVLAGPIHPEGYCNLYAAQA